MQRIKLWHWGALLILSAISILIYLVWNSMDNQRAVIWQDARTDCIRWSGLIATELDSSMEPAKRTIILYDIPPTSGSIPFDPNASDTILRQWKSEGGLTEAGLPVRVLAGLTLLERHPNLTDASLLVKIACQSEPSIITPIVLDTIIAMNNIDSINQPYLESKRLWERDEAARKIIRDHPSSFSSTSFPVWHVHDEKIWWFKNHKDKTSYLSPTSIERVLIQMKQKFNIPNWAGIQIQPAQRLAKLGDSGVELGKAYLRNLYVSVGVIDKSLLEQNWRKSRTWNILILALAGVGLAAGIVMLAYGEAMENKRQRGQNNFIASVTHELRAPVGSMRLMAETLAAGNVEESKIKQFHKHLAREGNRLSNLIENVLDLSQIEAGKSKHHPRNVNLRTLALSAAETLHMQAQEKNVTLKLSDTDMDISVNPLLFQQALVNLMDNAIKFSPEGETVRLTWKRNSNQWSLTIADSGPGIDPSEVKKIFNRFYRVGDEMTRETQGTGIGLYLVKHVVDMHSGTINIESKRGAHFTLTFPIFNSKPNSKPARKS